MPNQYKNKVQYIRNGVPEVLVDLTSDTVTPEALAQGYTAHDASGAPIVGTATGGSMVIRDEQDSHGGIVRHITAGNVVAGTVNITQNGVVDVAAYADANVNVTPPAPTLQDKTVSPTETQQIISADSGYDGLDEVTVNAISSTYVGSGISRKSSSDLTVSGAAVTAPVGYYSSAASKSVASGTAGTPTASKGSVSNHAISVTPSVTNTTGYISGGTKTGTAVSVSASELVSGTYTVSASGTADVTDYASISVPAQTLPTSASSTSSGTSKATISRSTSDQYINIPTGYNSAAAYYKVSAVANGTEGTPTATKGTVSNHAISVTPSVTNTAGYISGGTKTGTAVTVSASELVSGNYTISASGNHDVTNYATASVATGDATASATKGAVSNHSVTVTPSVTRTAGYITTGTASGTAVTVSASELVSGSETKTANGTYDVTNLASIVVNVPPVVGGVTQDQDGGIVLSPNGEGGGGLVYETGTFTPTTDVASTWITFSNSHTEPPFYYAVFDATGTYDETLQSNYMVEFIDVRRLSGNPIYSSSTSLIYARYTFMYRASSSTSISSLGGNITTQDVSGYATSTEINASTGSSSRYWRAGRTYKWIAAWAPTS